MRFRRIAQAIGLAIWFFILYWAYTMGYFETFGSIGFVVWIAFLLVGWLIIAFGLRHLLTQL